MTEEQKMIAQNNMDPAAVTLYNGIPYSVIADDLSSTQKEAYRAEMQEIVNLYTAYKKGESFLTEGSNSNYIPSDLRYKKAASIINKEARFLFANPPTFNINIDDVSEEIKKQNAIMQDFLDTVLRKNNLNEKLLKAAKDCFIGKRVALVLNFNDTSGITVTFLNSMEFIYETSGIGSNELQKLVMFSNLEDTSYKEKQRWFKKIYTLEEGVVYVEENIYDGLGKLTESVLEKTKTAFTYIPAVVILNDGLTGETKGESELGNLLSYEAVYSKLANADIDAERKGMNPTRYTIDASSESTANLSIAPGAYWDLQSDEDKAIERQAQVGMMEPTMAYSNALKTTLDRVENTMYAEVDVPNINSEQLQGVITSGKTLKALYWGLTVRCDEKMLTWGPALHFLAATIIEGGRLYPQSISKYTTVATLPAISCEIQVENNYPLPEDEAEEKTMDLAEIDAKVMSRKAYLKKWRKLNDAEAEAELLQIKAEQDLFENSVLPNISEDDIVDDNILDIKDQIDEEEIIDTNPMNAV